MKKIIIGLFALVFILISKHNYLNAEKTNCKFQCIVTHCSLPIQEDKLDSYQEGTIPYYPFYIKI